MERIISFILVAILCLGALTSCSVGEIKDKVVGIKDSIVDKVGSLLGKEPAEKPDEDIECTSHFWGEWVTTTAPTCTEAGVKTATCTNAGCGETKTEAIAALGHTAGAAATCTTAQICTVCKTELAAALGHTEGPKATCTTAQICTVCETELKAAYGHTFNKGDCKYCDAVDETYPVAPVTPSPIVNVAPVAGGKYHLALYHGNESYLKNLYFTGNTANKDHFLATSENVADAVVVEIEAVDGVDGAFRMFFMNGDVKTYIEVYEYTNSNDKLAGSLKLTATPENYYTYDADFGVALYTNADSGNQYYLGTYTKKDGVTYNTISASDFNYIDNTNVNSTQYPLVFVEVPETDPVAELDGEYVGSFCGLDLYYFVVDFVTNSILVADENANVYNGLYTFVYSKDTGIVATNTLDNTLTFTITADADGVVCATFPGSSGDIITTLRVVLPQLDLEMDNELVFEEDDLTDGVTYEFDVYNDGTYEFVCEGLSFVVYDELGELVAAVDGKYELVYAKYTVVITATAAGEYTLVTEYTAPLGSSDNPISVELPGAADVSVNANAFYKNCASVWFGGIAPANGIITLTADKENAAFGLDVAYEENEDGSISFKVIKGLYYSFYLSNTTWEDEDFVITLTYESAVISDEDYVASLIYNEFKVDGYTIHFGQDWDTNDYYISLSDEYYTTYLMFSFTAQLNLDYSITINPVYTPYEYENGVDEIGLDYSTITATIADGAWTFDFDPAEKTGFEGRYKFLNSWGSEIDVVVTPFEIRISFINPRTGMAMTDVYAYDVVDGAIVVYFNDEVADSMLLSVVVTDGAITALTYQGADYVKAPDPTGLEGEYAAEFDGVEATVIVNTTTFTVSYTHPMTNMPYSVTYEYVMVDGAPVVMINGEAADPMMAAINMEDGEIVSFVDNGVTFTVVVDGGNGEPNGTGDNPYTATVPGTISVDYNGTGRVWYTFTALANGTITVTFTTYVDNNGTPDTWLTVENSTEQILYDYNKVTYTFDVVEGETYMVGIGTWSEDGTAQTIVATISDGSDDNDECEHVPGDAATCTTAQTCTVCNAVLVAALGHTEGDAATCTTAQTCTVCNAVLVAALGHTEGAAATCTTAQTCTVCNAVLVAALGHTEGAAATCTTAQTCTVCSAVLVNILDHTDEDGDYLCDFNCETKLEPENGSVLTIAEALKLAALYYNNDNSKGYYGNNWYYVTGTIVSITNTKYGTCTITDGTDTISVYGLKSGDGSKIYENMGVKPVVGDTVKLYGKVGAYTNKAQMDNSNVVEHTAHTCSYSEATCTVAATCTICGAVNGNPIDCNYVNGTCTMCGGKEGEVATTVTVSIADYAAANSWKNSTKYSTLNMNSDITVTATGTDGNTGKYYTSGKNWRMYQKGNPSITIAAAEGKTIKTVKITYASENTGCLTLDNANVASGTVVTVNANSVTFSVGNTGTADNGQARITAIEVVYA